MNEAQLNNLSTKELCRYIGDNYSDPVILRLIDGLTSEVESAESHQEELEGELIDASEEAGKVESLEEDKELLRGSLGCVFSDMDEEDENYEQVKEALEFTQ